MNNKNYKKVLHWAMVFIVICGMIISNVIPVYAAGASVKKATERALISFKHTSRCCGENIARGQISVKKAMIDFKNSSRHNALMLLNYPDVLSVSVFAKYEGTVNGKKQYSLHYVQFYGIKLAASQQ